MLGFIKMCVPTGNPGCPSLTIPESFEVTAAEMSVSMCTISRLRAATPVLEYLSSA